MNKSSLTLALSLTALLGAGLVLPASAAAHDTNRDSRVARGHHHSQPPKQHQQHAAHHHVDTWHLLRHREARPYGYRPQPMHYRMQGEPHQRRDQRDYREQHDQHRHAPVRLQIGYEIVL